LLNVELAIFHTKRAEKCSKIVILHVWFVTTMTALSWR